MIPPHYFAAQLQAAQRRVRDGIQAVPTMETEGGGAQQPDAYFNDCVLDLSRYLTSTDMPSTPREFFDDLFHEKVAAGGDNPALSNKPGVVHHGDGGVIKVKEEPNSAATSRCSTPGSLLPEHDFEQGDFPTPKFQSGVDNNNGNHGSSGVSSTTVTEKNGSLMCQLQSIQQNGASLHANRAPVISSNNNNHNNNNNNMSSPPNNINTDSNDSNSDVEMDMENLDINAQKLKAALAQLKQNNNRDNSDGGEPTLSSPLEGSLALPNLPQGSLAVHDPSDHPHKNPLKSPRSKSRKSIEKGTDEYVVKRERNNVAVRKSRTKAKLKHIETQMRVGELTEENEQLRNRVASLQKELNALKSFISYNCPGNVKPPCFSSSNTYPPQQIFSTKIM